MNALFSWIKRGAEDKVASDTALLTSASYLSAALRFAATAIAARMLGSSEYGNAALALAYPGLIWSIANVKTVTVTTRYIASARATSDQASLLGICKVGYLVDMVAALAALAVVVGSGWWVAGSLYQDLELYRLMVIFALMFPFSSLSGTSWSILAGWEKFRWISALAVMEQLISLGLMIGLLLIGMGATGVIAASAAGQAVTGIAMLISATSLLRREGLAYWWSASLSSMKSLRRELAQFFGWNYLLVTATGLIGNLPVMFLGQFRSVEEAGYYRIAANLATVGGYFESSLGRVAYPRLAARWAKGDRMGVLAWVRRWTVRGGIPAGLLLAASVPALPFLVPLVFGPEFSAMVPGAQIMMLGASISTVFFWLQPFYYSVGSIVAWSQAFIGYSALVALGSWIIARQAGFIGIATLAAGGKAVLTVTLAALALARRSR